MAQYQTYLQPVILVKDRRVAAAQKSSVPHGQAAYEADYVATVKALRGYMPRGS